MASTRIRDIREARGLTQGELAARASLPPSAISHFETGARRPSYDNLLKIAAALECSIDQIAGLTTTSGLTAETQNTLSDLTFEEMSLVRDFAQMLIDRR